MLLGLLLLAGCAPAREAGGPSRSVVTGTGSTLYNFDSTATSWDVFAVQGDQALFRIHEGALEGAVVADRGYIWSLNHEQHDNVIINASIRQTEGRLASAYGVICRADAAGNGYYFLISGDQQFSISVGSPARNDLFPLVPWQYHSALRRGYVTNTIRAVCAGGYLAFFINDVFVAEATDREFTVGQLGVALGAVEQTAWVRFDDLLLRPAILRGER